MSNRLKIPDPLANVGRGFMMGAADIIPGVSGGTVALILGIYERLITAVSRFDLTFLRHIQKKEFGAAAKHTDLGFLGTLLLGIGIGIVGLGSLMHYLLHDQPQHTFGAFFGLILASSWHVARMIDNWTRRTVLLMILGTVGAYILVGLPFLKAPSETEWYIFPYLFFCGCIAICAMILPGISGAFILLILDTYELITGRLRQLIGGDISLNTIQLLGAFAIGAAVGLLSFSKVLQWLLDRHEKATLAVLCGFMLGSLRRIWPYKVDFEAQQFVNKLPDLSDGSVWMTIALMVVAFGFVLMLEWLTKSGNPASQHESTEV